MLMSPPSDSQYYTPDVMYIYLHIYIYIYMYMTVVGLALACYDVTALNMDQRVYMYSTYFLHVFGPLCSVVYILYCAC